MRINRKDEWLKDPRAKEIYKTCPFCESEAYEGPDAVDSEGEPGGDILIRYTCQNCEGEWYYWYGHKGTCWKDVNVTTVETLRRQGKIVIVTNGIQ